LETPDKELLERLVSHIDKAQEKIYVEVYIFTEKKLRDALIRAHTRGIDVKILLENNPYQAPYINDSHFDAFEAAGIDVRWSDPLNYSLNHAKLLLIDDF
jgi:cardiolipin synthase